MIRRFLRDVRDALAFAAFVYAMWHAAQYVPEWNQMLLEWRSR